ncbi:uncharacterized protein KY384_002162 [Bacidia gigantensis]|uniref:uncharacterized protein n=1 Tax=Bacidia gigantensis TaxID=2732470 RepID=UPI001D03AB76|nr:uncharacterized protein KY384_002162 [Bacidia gigantensis]KAG8533379.1 hypothetical protein KY384_002162 [Bacidia gigantensis]
MVRNVIDLTASDPPDIAPEVRQPFIDLPTSTIAKTLEVAIADANSDRLRATLRAVCRASKQTQALAQSLLLADDADARHVQIERNCNSDGFLTGSDDEEESEGRQDLESQPHLPRLLQDVSSMKRPRPRYVTCDNCDEEFDVKKKLIGTETSGQITTRIATVVSKISEMNFQRVSPGTAVTASEINLAAR